MTALSHTICNCFMALVAGMAVVGQFALMAGAGPT